MTYAQQLQAQTLSSLNEVVTYKMGEALDSVQASVEAKQSLFFDKINNLVVNRMSSHSTASFDSPLNSSSIDSHPDPHLGGKRSLKPMKLSATKHGNDT